MVDNGERFNESWIFNINDFLFPNKLKKTNKRLFFIRLI